MNKFDSLWEVVYSNFDIRTVTETILINRPYQFVSDEFYPSLRLQVSDKSGDIRSSCLRKIICKVIHYIRS